MKNLLLVSLLCLIAGCATFNDAPAVKTELEKEQELGEIMLEAFRKRDLKSFTQFIPAGGSEQYGKEEFAKEQQEVASRLGEIVSYRFLTQLEMEPLHQLVWAVRFRSHNLKCEPVYREALFVIVVGKIDESRKVFLFGFK